MKLSLYCHTCSVTDRRGSVQEWREELCSCPGRSQRCRVPSSSHPDSRVTNPSSLGGTQVTVSVTWGGVGWGHTAVVKAVSRLCPCREGVQLALSLLSVLLSHGLCAPFQL